MKSKLVGLLAIGGVVLVLAALLLPNLDKARESARRVSPSYEVWMREQQIPTLEKARESARWVSPGYEARMREQQMMEAAYTVDPSAAVDGAPADFNTEAYDAVVHNAFRLVLQHPLSTFATDVDTASYANIRRMLREGQMPPGGAVRIEEMINYFDYNYPQPGSAHPFSVNVEVSGCPWKEGRRLVRIGLKGREVTNKQRPTANLVFLLDVSGSMSDENKLPLVKRSMKLLVEQMNARDRIAIVVYAGASGLVLPSTACDDERAVLDVLDELESGGSTNGGEGIELAYRVAAQNFIQGGINRVVLCTDGDFNVGTTDQGALVDLIEDKAKTGVYLTVLGFGMGNYKDSTLEKLADKGNGNYGYIDTFDEARKVFVDQVNGTLVTIAKDVKIQVEFNPARVKAYRLIGYENRLLADEDFNDDTKDAGDIGAGHTVTALYELVLPGEEIEIPNVDPLKYQEPATPAADPSDDLLTVKLRYKDPDGEVSKLVAVPVADAGISYAESTEDHRFAAAVAAFGMILRESPYKGSSSYAAVLELADDARGDDEMGYRKEFIRLVRTAQANAATVIRRE